MGRKRLTTEQFIENILCSEVHPDGKYNYKDVDYVGVQKNIEIYCNDCGRSFLQTPSNHKMGSGCQGCYNKTRRLTIGEISQKLTIEEEPTEVNGELQCRCSYCKEYFLPTRQQLWDRIDCLGGGGGECRLYCSDGCKQRCPVFNRSKHYKDNNITKPDTSRTDQLELRQLTLTRDNNQCQHCGSTTDLHCHHITGTEINPVESADVDNCITLCYTCHNKVHSSGQCNVRRQPCVV